MIPVQKIHKNIKKTIPKGNTHTHTHTYTHTNKMASPTCTFLAWIDLLVHAAHQASARQHGHGHPRPRPHAAPGRAVVERAREGTDRKRKRRE